MLMSVPPPAGHGTINVTGFVGKFCACAAKPKPMANVAAIADENLTHFPALPNADGTPFFRRLRGDHSMQGLFSVEGAATIELCGSGE